MSREPNIDLIVATIGAEATLALVKKEGGKIRRVPAKPPEWLLIALPEDQHPAAAQQLCNLFRDSVITIPKAMAWRRAQRDRQIITAYERHLKHEPGGMTVHDLVEAFDLTEKQIRLILNRPTPAEAPSNTLRPHYGGLAHQRDADTVDMFLTESQS